MATITLNVLDSTLDEFRNAVKNEKGIGKGKLGEAANEALKMWAFEKEQKVIADRQIEFLRKGFHMGKLKKFNREDLYDRKL